MSLYIVSKIILWTLSIVVGIAGYQSCNKDMVWEKVRGMKPELAREIRVLYRGIDSQGIVAACFEKCKSQNCNAFIINLEKSYCFSVDWKGNDFGPEPNVTFYHKICLKVPESCLTKYWQVERSLGSILHDSAAVNTTPEITTRAECYETCINKVKNCKAAQFQTSRDLFIGDITGSCTLLTIEREMKPQAYRASLYRNEYLQNQCHNVSKTEFCSYAEFEDALMPYSDLQVTGVNTKQCEKRCDESNDGFLCRAFGIERVNSNRTTCYLYSDDTIGNGVSSLVASPNSSYREREPCIDMNVHCTSSSLIVQLRTAEPFNGKLYASGFSDNCSAHGHGENLTILVLPLPDFKSTGGSSACGLALSYQDNQTSAIVWSTVIVQFNPIIQRLGDQAVRVGCSFINGSIPLPQNISVNSGFTFVDPNAGLPPIVSTVVNSSSVVPTISMYILDENLRPANVTHLGQKLILKIEMSPKQGPFDITAGYLLASSYSEDSSLLLLDELGCPITQIFPALGKDPADNRSLVAEFSAFKFPNSQRVRFNVIVKFCLDVCTPVRCDNRGATSRRRKRSVPPSEDSEKKTPLWPSNSTMDQQIPLQTTIIVQDSKSASGIVPNPLRSTRNPDTFVILDPGGMDSQFCMDANLLLFFMTIFLMVQLILIGSCVFSLRNYRRLAIKAEEDRADILARHLYGIHGGNFGISRRVRWVDNGTSVQS
ncbi:uncharacterized protein LOC106638085 [Copidosoma floridanum]|uniref:uncharacterized protein LOC106638085 n=1 Tax=Copidosoma floridanum TaxID=29053 RepID=UPI0006C9D4B7|nr:uncharacterized protein LOC106638085 [Copidosoma floridanum]